MATDAITPTAKQSLEEIKRKALEEQRARQKQEMLDNLEMLGGPEVLDWDHLSPRAQVAYLMNKVYSVRQSDGSYADCQLDFWDAVGMVAYARDNKLSVIGNDLFPTIKMVGGKPKMTNIGKSSEAKAKMAANNGAVYGPPDYEEKRRPWPVDARKQMPAWAKEDIGVSCTITYYVKDQEGKVHAEPKTFVAWLSEWYEGTGSGKSYWDKNPLWMLRVRSKDKNIILSTGVGQSDAQEGDDPVAVLPAEPEIKTTEFRPKNPPPLAIPPPPVKARAMAGESDQLFATENKEKN